MVAEYQKLNPHITFKINIECNTPYSWCNESAIHEALSNIVMNSIDALKEKDSNYKAITFTLFRESNFLCIQIVDNGTGISKHSQKKVVDLLFAVNANSAHWGLGFSQAKEIIRSHNGHIHLKSVPGQYTLVQIILPR